MSGSITDFAPHHSKNGSLFGILVIKEQEDPSFGTGGPVKTVTASRGIDRTRERKEHFLKNDNLAKYAMDTAASRLPHPPLARAPCCRAQNK